jgi:hypothetical protein
MPDDPDRGGASLAWCGRGSLAVRVMASSGILEGASRFAFEF